MKHLFTILCFWALANLAMAQETVRGTVTDELGLVLPGVNVYIEAQSIIAATDASGQYFLVNVPTGTHKVIYSFIGYGTVTQDVTVTEGQTTIANVSLEPGVTIGEEVLILGDRLKGQAKALNQQKNNINVTNVVAADQIGRFPDANIGDALKRIQGITIQGDQGEARNIIIRGLAPQLNSVTINGERIPSAEGDNRNIQLDLIPSDMVQLVEVNKAVTPDMDADAIGGSVNLLTRSASSGLRVSGTLASGLNFLTDEPLLTGGFVIGNRIANDKLGIVISANYNLHDLGSDNIEAEWEDEAEDFNGDDIPLTYVGEMDIRQYYLRRVRRSISANLDYQFDENNTVFLEMLYNRRDDWENRYRARYRKIAPIFDANNNITGWEGELRRQTKAGGTIYDDRVDDRRLEDQRVYNSTLRGQHLLGSAKLDWSVTRAQASEKRPFERYIRFESADAFALNYDISNPKFPAISAANPANVATDQMVFDELTEEDQYTEEQDNNARIDLQLPTSIGDDKGFVKFGFRYRGKEKSRSNEFFDYSPTDNNTAYENMSLVANQDYSKNDYLAGDYAVGTFMTPAALAWIDLEDFTLFEEERKPDEYLAGNYTASETILGGYAMWNQTFGDKLTVLAGVRVENTEIDYTGNILENEEDLIREETATDNYTNFLPGIHLKYNVNDNFVLRAAWTNTLARPNYYDLVPFQDIRPDDEELIQGNPNLNPTESMNFDLMAENYFKSIGLISAGVFYKNIDNFIYTFVDENYVDATITGGNTWTRFQPENGGTANLFGAEIAFQRQLDFLPGALKGLGIYLNYTYTNSDAEGIRNEDGEVRTDLALPGTAPHLLNASLSYETAKLVVRVSLNYADDYVDEVGGSDFSDRYYDRQLFLDVNGSYAITDNVRFFFELNNLTNQPLRYYQGERDRVMQAEYYNARLSAGFKFDMFKKR